MKIVPFHFLVVTLAFFIALPAAQAARFFVRPTINETATSSDPSLTLSKAETDAATNLVRHSVAARDGDTLATTEKGADFILQPRLLKVEKAYLLRIEKLAHQRTVYIAQERVPRLQELDSAARDVTAAVIAGVMTSSRSSRRGVGIRSRQRRSETDTVSGATRSASELSTEPIGPMIITRTPELLPIGNRYEYWTVALGPFVGKKLGSDSTMYGFTAGRTWELTRLSNSILALKAFGQASLSSGTDHASFYDIGGGANYFFSSNKTATFAPYASLDVGYAMANDADNKTSTGVSTGVGIGAQVYRATELTLDVIARYTVLFNMSDSDNNPAVLGAQIAVNF